MIEVPADPRDADLLQSFARIGVGPGLDIDALDASTKRGLARAAVDGRRISYGAFADGCRRPTSTVGITLLRKREG